ncbi:MAG: hypothetical protein ACTHOE_10775 [Conexibacter sp.]
MPRVLHAPTEVANQAAVAALGLRELGVPSHAFARVHAFGYAVAPDIVPGPSRLSWIRQATRAVREHDVVHFYFAQTFLPEVARGLDARLLRRAGRRVVVEFMGSDVRVPSVERARNPRYVQLPGEDDALATARMRRWSAITGGHGIICDRTLRVFLEPHFEHVHVAPFRIDTRRFTPTPPTLDARTPVIVHAPSNLAVKGTKHVRAAMEELRRRGADFEYVEIHGMSNSEAAAACARADLVIDQLCAGAHGVFAVEAMCMAKPVLCHILPELRGTYPPDLPIVEADPDTLADVLEDWLARPADRHELGLASRAYAERVHDARVVARQLLEIYEQLPSGRGRG